MASLTSVLPTDPVTVEGAVQATIPGLEFAATDGIHYTRRLHGKERMAALTSGLGQGGGQLTGIGDFQFKQNLSREQLEAHVRAAWIRLRFQAPWVGYRCKALNGSEPNSFYFEYKKSSKADAAEAWADDSIVWRTESYSHQEWEGVLKQVHWSPGSGHVAVEMHIAKGSKPNQWFFMWTWPHQTADARGMFSAVDRFLRNLQTELEGSAPSYQSIPWGEELVRLAPTSILTVPDVGANDMPAASQDKPTQFQRIPLKERQVTGFEGIHHFIHLSTEETKAVMVNCKRYKASLTAVINSILMLAEIETILQLAADASVDEFAKIIESFRTSQVFTVEVNIADMRAHVYPKYAKALGGCTTGGCVNVGFATNHNMDHVRRCIQIGADGKITRNLSGSGFWDGVVPDTQNGLKIGGRQPPHAFHLSSQMAEAFAPQLDQFPVTSQCMIASSLGSVERMGIFTPFSPINASEYPNSLFQVHHWVLGMNTTNFPSMVGHTWEYNGRLVVNIQGSKKWQTEKSFRLYVEAVRARLGQITSLRATL